MRWDGERDSSGPRYPGRRLRLLLACQRLLIGAALMQLLERQGHEVVSHAGDADTFAAALHGAGFDLALVEIGLALPDPAAFAARLLDTAVPLVLLAPSANCPGLSRIAASQIDGQIAGLALESESAESLWLCLAAVAAGGRWFDRAALADNAEHREAERDARLLTRRERDVARLVATGQRNRAIAGSLGISEGTVKMHLHNVYAKLGLESRTQLAMDERLRMHG